MDRGLIEAFGVDSLGLLIYAGVLTTINNPPAGLSPQNLMALGLVFPIAAYVVSYKRYREHFWKAFLGSLAFGVVLLFGGFWIYTQMAI